MTRPPEGPPPRWAADVEMEPVSRFSRCFGCGSDNPQGLGLSFVQVGEHTVECRYVVPDHLNGAPGVVHGGIQATLLDETMGYAVRTAVGYGRSIVTAEISLRYRKAVPTGTPIVVSASVDGEDSGSFHVVGSIVQRASGGTETELTSAKARWRLVD